jgi:hypothetical protein
MNGLIDQIEFRLREINGVSHFLHARDFVMPTKAQNTLLISETGDHADIAICLMESLLNRFQSLRLPQDFTLEVQPALSVIVEELSHFNFYCVNASHGREISGLDMELQAEIDKFSFALDCLHEQNLKGFEDQLFEMHFGQLRLGEWVKPEEQERYVVAHSIARAFCRELLRQSEVGDRRSLLQRFFKAPLGSRLSWAKL